MTDDEYTQLLEMRRRLAARARELNSQGQFYQAAIWRAKSTGIAMVVRKFTPQSKRLAKIEDARRRRLEVKLKKARLS